MAPANQTKMHVALYCLWLLLIRIGQSVIQRAATACQESLSSMIYRRYVFTSVKITSRSGSSWSACVASLVGYSLLQVNRASFWMSSLLQHQPILFLCMCRVYAGEMRGPLLSQLGVCKSLQAYPWGTGPYQATQVTFHIFNICKGICLLCFDTVDWSWRASSL